MPEAGGPLGEEEARLSVASGHDCHGDSCPAELGGRRRRQLEARKVGGEACTQLGVGTVALG
jgi:hypothetical protein